MKFYILNLYGASCMMKKMLRTMKLTLAFLIVTMMQVSASGFAQNKITLSEKNASLEKVLKSVRKQSGYNVFFILKEIKNAKPVSINVNQATLEETLNEIFKNQPLTYAIEYKTVVVQKRKETFYFDLKTQSIAPIDVTGKILDENGQGIPGASVKVKGTSNGSVTDAKGFFGLKNVDENATLIISYVGYDIKEVKVSKSEMSIKLTVTLSNLDEVVVVAYGVQKKISVIGAQTSISTKDLLQTPAANITNALGGRLPGLVSLQTSGDPGRDAASLLVRGKGTYTGNTAPLVLVDGVERSFSTIDANEIETVTILKDASSTAVYGIRGANGVILVTTRRGSNQKPVISFTANTGVQQFTRLPEFVNSYEYATLKNEGYVNEGKAPAYNQTMLDGYLNHTDPYLYPDVDWAAEFLKKNSMMQQYNVNVVGGSNLVKYFISGSILSQDGAYKHTKSADFDETLNYKRYNFRSNLDFDLSPSTKIAVNLGVRNDLRKGPYTDHFGGDATSRIFSTIMRLPPNAMAVINPDGSFGVPSSRLDADVAGIAGQNLLADLTQSGEKREYSNIIDGSIVLNQKLDKILKGLSLSGNFSMTNAYSQITGRFRPIIAGGPVNNFYARYAINGQNADGSYIYGGAGSTANQPLISFAETNTLDNKRWYTEGKLDYKGNTGNHHYSALALFNASRETIPVVANGPISWPKSYMGIASRVTYDYDNRYLAEFNLGYNGSENFAVGKRFGLFPAYALGWVASNESFLKNSKTISLLKFRGSYGEVGSDQGIGRFAFFNKPYTQSGSYAFGLTNNTTVLGYNEGSFGNANVQWEVAKKYNIGLETKFFKDLIGLNVDVFKEKRDQILAAYGTVPAILGVVTANLPSANIGKMENKGFEIELSHNNKIGSFDYWAKANVSFARNKVLFRDETTQPYPYLQKTGNPVDQQYGMVTNGFFNSQAEIDAWYAAGNSTTYATKTASGKIVPGDFKYIDQNGDKIINELDIMPIGKPTSPEYMGAFSFGASYKNFDISAMFQGSTNTSMFVSNEAGWAFFNAGKAFKENLNRWTPETASTATYPRMASSPTGTDYDYVNNDFWLKNASYLRLKQAQIGYTLNKDFLQKISLRSARIYVDGANLYTWSRIKYLDPENRNSRAFFYPQQRVLNFGLNITL